MGIQNFFVCLDLMPLQSGWADPALIEEMLHVMENTTKQQIIQKYEEEARERDSDAWYAAGDSARVPESQAARYFIDRKVSEALRLLAADYRRDARVLEIGYSFGHRTITSLSNIMIPGDLRGRGLRSGQLLCTIVRGAN